LKSGRGGGGAVSFETYPNKAVAPPDGGHGGDGGNVVLKPGKIEVIPFPVSSREFHAGDGKNGSRRNQTGARGQDCVIEVPAHTMVYELREEKEVTIFESLFGKSIVLLKGGRGGAGNSSRKSSRNRSPTERSTGYPGIIAEFEFRVKFQPEILFLGTPEPLARISLFLSGSKKVRGNPPSQDRVYRYMIHDDNYISHDCITVPIDLVDNGPLIDEKKLEKVFYVGEPQNLPYLSYNGEHLKIEDGQVFRAGRKIPEPADFFA